jgi:hypothetical protein
MDSRVNQVLFIALKILVLYSLGDFGDKVSDDVDSCPAGCYRIDIDDTFAEVSVCV